MSSSQQQKESKQYFSKLVTEFNSALASNNLILINEKKAKCVNLYRANSLQRSEDDICRACIIYICSQKMEKN